MAIATVFKPGYLRVPAGPVKRPGRYFPDQAIFKNHLGEILVRILNYYALFGNQIFYKTHSGACPNIKLADQAYFIDKYQADI
ncbi:MAG TPA: hypothetical protein VM123_17835 [archaeon]|nr:hypothetical protein [archaeon]